MAGLGRKVFNAGEVLSAANVQGYLQDQVVQVYSGTAARSSALGTAVSEGMMSYLTDSNELSVYTSNGTAAWSAVNLAQSPNAIINGAFDFWQRGTSFSANNTYTADRWRMIWDGTGTRSISQQTFTPGTAPVAGYEGQFFYRYQQATAGSGATYSVLQTKIEDVRTFAGQTITFSFWAKSASPSTIGVLLEQEFGSGGSGRVDTYVLASTATTTGWVRYSATATLPSIAGKTIGVGSSLNFSFTLPINTTFTTDLWGVQLEAGSVATPFRRSSPTLQGELAACQRYYQRYGDATSALSLGSCYSTTDVYGHLLLPVQMRTSPTFGVSRTAAVVIYSAGSGYTSTSVVADNSNPKIFAYRFTTSGLTAGRVGQVGFNASTDYIELSAEL